MKETLVSLSSGQAEMWERKTDAEAREEFALRAHSYIKGLRLDNNKHVESVQVQVGGQTSAEGIAYLPDADWARLQSGLLGRRGDPHQRSALRRRSMSSFLHQPARPRLFHSLVVPHVAAMQMAGPAWYLRPFLEDLDIQAVDRAMEIGVTVDSSMVYWTIAHALRCHPSGPLKRCRFEKAMLLANRITETDLRQGDEQVNKFINLLRPVRYGGADAGVRVEVHVHYDAEAVRERLQEVEELARETLTHTDLLSHAVAQVMAAHWSLLRPSALPVWTVQAHPPDLDDFMQGAIRSLWRACKVLLVRHMAPAPPIWRAGDQQAFHYLWEKLERVGTLQIPKARYAQYLDGLCHGWFGVPSGAFELDPEEDTYLGLVEPISDHRRVGSLRVFDPLESPIPPRPVRRPRLQGWAAHMRYFVASTNVVSHQYRPAWERLLRVSSLLSAWNCADLTSSTEVRRLVSQVCHMVVQTLVDDTAYRLSTASSLSPTLQALLPAINEGKWNHREVVERAALKASSSNPREAVTVVHTHFLDFFCRALLHKNSHTHVPLKQLFHPDSVSNCMSVQKYREASAKYVMRKVLASANHLMATTVSPHLNVALVRDCMREAVNDVITEAEMEVFPDVTKQSFFRDVHRRFVVLTGLSRVDGDFISMHRDPLVIAIVEAALARLREMASSAESASPKGTKRKVLRVTKKLRELARTFNWAWSRHRTIVYAVLFHSTRVSGGLIDWLHTHPEGSGLMLADLLAGVLLRYGHGRDAAGDGAEDIRCVDDDELQILTAARSQLRSKSSWHKLRRILPAGLVLGQRLMTGLCTLGPRDAYLRRLPPQQQLLITSSAPHAPVNPEGVRLCAEERFIDEKGLDNLYHHFMLGPVNGEEEEDGNNEEEEKGEAEWSEAAAAMEEEEKKHKYDDDVDGMEEDVEDFEGWEAEQVEEGREESEDGDGNEERGGDEDEDEEEDEEEDEDGDVGEAEIGDEGVSDYD
jgi:hypothetical protein